MAAKLFNPHTQRLATITQPRTSSQHDLCPQISSNQQFLCPEVHTIQTTNTPLRLMLLSAAILHSIKKTEPELVPIKTQNELVKQILEIKDLKEKDVERKEEIDQLDRKAQSLHNQLSEQENVMSQYEKKYERINVQLNQLQHTNESLELQNREHCIRVHEKESIVSAIRAENDELIKDRKVRSVEMNKQLKTIEALIQDRQCATNNINELSTKLEQSESSKSAEIAKLSEEVQSTQTSYAALLTKTEAKDQKSEEMRQSFEEEIRSLKVQVSGLQEENKTLKEKFDSIPIPRAQHDDVNGGKNLDNLQKKLSSTVEKRKLLFGQIQDVRGNVRVFCRIRPQPPKRKGNPFISLPTATTGNNWTVIYKDEYFTFDRVFQAESTNSDVYRETAGVVELVLSGSNVCIMAYGQTGSGKTHTMEGCTSDPGVNLRALDHLFNLINDTTQTAKVQMSALEIYNDGIYDLLGETSEPRSKSRKQEKRPITEQLHIRDLPASPHHVHVPGLAKISVMCVQDVQKAMQKARKMRSTKSTSMNASSSRSHSIIQVEVLNGPKSSKLHLVDLAGSERIDRSKVNGERLVETRHINKSLAALGNVFSALENNNRHIPYRDTKLTHFLKQSIGARAKTLLFVTVSNNAEDKFETSATLEFGKRVGKLVLSDNQSEEKIDRLRCLEKELLQVDREIETLTNQIDK